MAFIINEMNCSTTNDQFGEFLLKTVHTSTYCEIYRPRCREGKVIVSVRGPTSVCRSDCFTLCLLNELTFEVEFLGVRVTIKAGLRLKVIVIHAALRLGLR